MTKFYRFLFISSFACLTVLAFFKKPTLEARYVSESERTMIEARIAYLNNLVSKLDPRSNTYKVALHIIRNQKEYLGMPEGYNVSLIKYNPEERALLERYLKTQIQMFDVMAGAGMITVPGLDISPQDASSATKTLIAILNEGDEYTVLE